MVLKIASLVLLCGCLVAAKETDSQQKRQTYLGSPQAGRYLSGDAYQLHQSRLTASLAQSEEEADSAAQAQNDEELRRDAISNAKLAADSFKQSYRQSRVQPQPYAYATQEPVQQQYQQQPQHQQRQQQLVAYAPTTAAPQQQQYQQQPQHQQRHQQPVAYAPTTAAPQQPEYQPALQALYQNSPALQRLPNNSPASLQNYQAHAQLAEEAAKAFQEALQQRSSRQKRPRIQNPQYILEQQHSFVVPEQTSEQYNLAAVQQAYQQIEQQQRQAVDDIRASEARPAAPTAQTSQQEYDESSLGFNIGDGPSNYEPERQRGQKKYNLRPAPEQDVNVEIKSRRPSTVRNRPVVSQTYQAETPRVPVYQTEQVTAAPVQYESIQSQVPYEFVQQYQQKTTPEPAIPTYQPQEVPRAETPARQPVRIPAAPTPTQPIFLPTPTPPVTRIATPQRVAAPAPARVAAPAPARAPVSAPARIAAPAPVQIPQAYQAQTAPAPVQIPQAYPAQIGQTYPTQVAPASVRIPAAPVRIPSAPVQIPAASAQYPGAPAGLPAEAIDGKLVNLDLNLLRSLYQAAEALAKKQKDDVGPVTEDELIKALIEQGKREEQQAAEQLKKAKAEPERPKVEVVRIPKPKQITQEELQALIAAGYDITPIDEEPTAKNADPIKQQYLRQAEFLERQAVYRSQKPNTRRARDDTAVQDEVATD